MTSWLWEPIDIGEIPLEHRLAMAPMTRDRSAPDGAPTEMNATYYAQRASTALIITEGTQPSDDGQGYLLTPGIYRAEHVDAWRRVSDAVHDGGGRIVVQLMHVGRISHPSNTPYGRQPVAPSAVKPEGSMFTASGMQEMPVPRELSIEEIAQIGAGRTGIQISPGNTFNDIVEEDVTELYAALVSALAPLGLAYLNLAHQGDEEMLRGIRRDWPGVLILNRADADIDRRAQDVKDGVADVVSVGRMALANPDLVERVKSGASLNDPDPATFYGGEAHGYIDSPTLDGNPSS